jgi:membrane protease YdiL (CAAX protease family)
MPNLFADSRIGILDWFGFHEKSRGSGADSSRWRGGMEYWPCIGGPDATILRSGAPGPSILSRDGEDNQGCARPMNFYRQQQVTDKPWSLESIWRMVMMIMFTLCVCILLADISNGLTAGWVKEDVETLNFVLGTLGFQGATLFWTVWLLRTNRLGLGEAFGVGRLEVKSGVRLAIVSGLAITGVALFLGWISSSLMTWLGFEPEAQAAVQILHSTRSIPKQFLYGAVAIVVAPVAEEVLFRGILYPTLKQLGWPRAALWGTALMFGAIHLNWMAMLPLTVVALALTWLYEETGDLLAPILAHSVFNIINFTLLIASQQFSP